MRHWATVAVLSLLTLIVIAASDRTYAQDTGYATFGRTPEPGQPRAIPTMRILPDTPARPEPPRAQRSEATPSAPVIGVSPPSSPAMVPRTIRTVRIRADSTVPPKPDV